MRFFAMLIIVALACNSTALAFQTTQPYASEQVQTVELKKIAKVKAEVEKGGIGQEVRVKLRNKAEVKGYISKIDDRSFQVTDHQSGQGTSIAYQDADRIRRRGPGSSTGAKIAIAAAIGIGIAVAVSLLRLRASGE